VSWQVNEQFQRDLAELRVTMATQESEAAARLASKEDELHTHYQTHYQTLYDEFVVTHQRNEEAAAQVQLFYQLPISRSCGLNLLNHCRFRLRWRWTLTVPRSKRLMRACWSITNSSNKRLPITPMLKVD
jgi:hypothetical protein